MAEAGCEYLGQGGGGSMSGWCRSRPRALGRRRGSVTGKDGRAVGRHGWTGPNSSVVRVIDFDAVIKSWKSSYGN